MQRLDIGNLTDPVTVAPGEEPDRGVIVRDPRILVADGGGEEFEKAARRMFASVGDDARHQKAVDGTTSRTATTQEKQDYNSCRLV